MRAETVLWDRFNGKWHLVGMNPWPIVKRARACESFRILAAGNPASHSTVQQRPQD